jgi:hypothetical protein
VLSLLPLLFLLKPPALLADAVFSSSVSVSSAVPEV